MPLSPGERVSKRRTGRMDSARVLIKMRWTCPSAKIRSMPATLYAARCARLFLPNGLPSFLSRPALLDATHFAPFYLLLFLARISHAKSKEKKSNSNGKGKSATIYKMCTKCTIEIIPSTARTSASVSASGGSEALCGMWEILMRNMNECVRMRRYTEGMHNFNDGAINCMFCRD